MILKEQPKFKGSAWKNIDNGAKDICKKLLMKDPDDRISLFDAITHPWVQANELQMLRLTESQIDIHNIIKSLKNFKTEHRFQKEVIKIMVMFLSDAEIKYIREVFKNIDTNHNGIISHQNLKEFLIRYDEYNSDEEITQMIQSLHLTDPHN